MRAIGLLPAAALIAGAASGVFLTTLSIGLMWLLPAVLLVAAACWCLGACRTTTAALSLGFCIVGCVLGADARSRALHPTLRAVLDGEYGAFAIGTLGPEGRHEPLRLRAVLTEDAADNGDFVSLRVRADAVLLRNAWHHVEGGVTLTVAGSDAGGRRHQWRAGRTIEAPVVFRRPATYLNDGVTDSERDLALGGTTLFASTKSSLLVDVTRHGTVVQEASADVRAHVRHAIDRWVSSRDPIAGAIVNAILIGDRTGLPDEVRSRLQAAGTYHVIAISGGNIAIFVALTVILLSIAGVRGRPAALVSVLVLLGYAQIVAAGPSVWRATLMAVLYLLARALDHRAPAWHTMAVAAATMVVASPLDVRQPGFILTFGATAALVAAAAHGRGVVVRHGALGWVVASIFASAASELVLLPVGATAFSRVTAAGLLLNLLAVPMMGLVQLSGIAIAILDRVEWVARSAGWTAYAGATVLVQSARLVDAVPWLTRRVPAPGVFLVATYYAALLVVFIAMRRRTRLAGALVCVGAGVAIVGGYGIGSSPVLGAGRVRLTVFDVGQGESMLLQTPDARSMLIDAGGLPFGGGAFDVGGRVIAPALWALGVRSLESLLVTHGDPDHLTGARSVIDDFNPRRVWTGIPVPRHLPTTELLRHAADRGIPEEPRRVGDILDLGRVRIRVLHPPEPDWERQRVRNDDSVVIEVVYGDVSMLLTGDISAAIERTILPLLTPARVRVLKVAHHGSRTSTSRELLEQWRPQIAIISCGRGNRFGHPSPEVLQRLEAVGARVYRTDRDGEVTVDTDGADVSVRTYVSRLPR